MKVWLLVKLASRDCTPLKSCMNTVSVIFGRVIFWGLTTLKSNMFLWFLTIHLVKIFTHCKLLRTDKIEYIKVAHVNYSINYMMTILTSVSFPRHLVESCIIVYLFAHVTSVCNSNILVRMLDFTIELFTVFMRTETWVEACMVEVSDLCPAK